MGKKRGGRKHNRARPVRPGRPGRLGRPGRPGRPARETAKAGRRTLIVVAVLVITGLVVGGGVYAYQRLKAQKEAALGVKDTVRIETTKGLVVMEVYPDLMPVTVANFENLVRSGFYDGLTWHRVEDWVVQTGDPTGTGRGGSDQTIELEVSPALKNIRGAVGMARTQDPNSATSQFYILKSNAPWLDGAYAVFGKVVRGMDVVDKLEQGDRVTKITVEAGTQ